MRACADAWERQGRGRIEWHGRSLEAFGDEPLEEVADQYDLLLVDHPFCGTAERTGSLLPLDELLDSDTLVALDTAAVGPSQRSYRYHGQTWALASDAACQVSAFRADVLSADMPASWPAAVELVRALGSRAALPLAPAHAISSLLTLWAGAGLDPLTSGRLVDPARGLEQLEWLTEIHRHGNPAATRWEPPQALAALTAGELEYVPLTYGYVNYSRPDRDGLRCRFAGIPGAAGAVLGGAGVAVSAACSRPHDAASFAAWVCSRQVQLEIVAPNGGQPASAACWEDPELDAGSGGFYSATRPTIEAAWVRPRGAWWPSFQSSAGRAMSAALERRTSPQRLLERLVQIHDQARLRSVPAR
jgi:multiple sugar transport system substrate-binding protein